MRFSVDDIADLGSILGIWAHPDDESWCIAGVMLAARQHGQPVACVTATAGDAGKTTDETAWLQDRLGAIRKQELERVLDYIGGVEHTWLDYADGKLAEADAAGAIAGLAETIARVQPDTIFTFEPEGVTGHDDHKTISSWTVAAAQRAAPQAAVYGAVTLRETYETAGKRLDESFDIYFNTAEPVLVTEDEADICFHLPDEILDKKLECLRLQASQMSGFFADDAMADDVRAMFATEQFIRLR